LTNPESRQKVPLWYTSEGLGQLGYGDQVKQAYADAGVWNPSSGRWNNNIAPWAVQSEGGGVYDYAGTPPEGYSTWDAYNDYAKYLEDLGITSPSQRKRKVTNPWEMMGGIGY